MWTAEAFGGTAGFQHGYVSWVADAIDSAMCATIALNELLKMFGWSFAQGSFWGYVMRASIAMVLALPIFFGVGFVGRVAKRLACIIAFIVLVSAS